MVVFGKSGCILAKVVVLAGKVVLFGLKWLNAGKMVVLGQRSYSGKSGCIRAK